MNDQVILIYLNVNGGQKQAVLSLSEAIKSNVKIKLLPFTEQKKSGSFSYVRTILSTLYYLLRLIASKNQNVYFTTHYLAAIALFLSKRKYFFLFHGETYIDPKFIGKKLYGNLPKYLYCILINNILFQLQKFALNKARGIIAPSHFSKKFLIDKYQIQSHKLLVINNFLLPKCFATIHERNAGKTQYIGYFGRLDSKKGLNELLFAWNSFVESGKSKEYILLLARPPLTSVDESVFDTYLKLSKKIRNSIKPITVSSKEVQHWYKKCDVVLLPSYEEHLPLVLLEALACGVPVIGSPVGEMRNILNKVEPKLLLTKVTPKNIKNKLEWFVGLEHTQKKSLQEKCFKIAQDFKLNKSQLLSRFNTMISTLHPLP